MPFTSRPSPETPAASAALATLGMVGLLLFTLTERVLPRCRGVEGAEDALLRLNLSMSALAALSWQDVEAPSRSAALLERMVPVVTTLRDALLEVLAILARSPAWRRLARRGCGAGGPVDAEASRGPALARRGVSGLPRDGPPPRAGPFPVPVHA